MVVPQPCKVVVVDDESQVVEYVLEILKAAGFEARGATSALAALKEIDQLRPDLVITDMDMPGLDGNELTTVLKSRPETRAIPVLFLSGMTSSEDYAIAHFSGATAYLDKPFAVEDLLRAVAKVLPSKTLQKLAGEGA